MITKKIDDFIFHQDAKISVILKDLKKKKVIYRYDESRQLPSASIIKIIIMLEAINQVLKGNFSFEEIINIEDRDKVEFSIITELDINRYTYKDIITLMIIVSDNTATNILIDLLGKENINKFIRDLGLESTILQRKMMDFNAARSGKQNYTSPSDMMKTLELIYNREILNEHMCNFAIDVLKRQKDKQLLARYLPPKTIIAHKTGELENLNHDIGIISLDDREYILGVFITEANNNLKAKQMIGKISKIVYDHFRN